MNLQSLRCGDQALGAFRRCLHTILTDERVLDIAPCLGRRMNFELQSVFWAGSEVEHQMTLHFSRLAAWEAAG